MFGNVLTRTGETNTSLMQGNCQQWLEFLYMYYVEGLLYHGGWRKCDEKVSGRGSGDQISQKQ